jgi:hypothetical protein
VHWRKLHGYRHCTALINGVKFRDGIALQAKTIKPARTQLGQVAT